MPLSRLTQAQNGQGELWVRNAYQFSLISSRHGLKLGNKRPLVMLPKDHSWSQPVKFRGNTSQTYEVLPYRMQGRLNSVISLMEWTRLAEQAEHFLRTCGPVSLFELCCRM